MDKDHILFEIVRTAKENGGIPLGRKRFEKETGIKESDVCGKYWTKWSDAVLEAGFQPNKMQSAYDDNYILQKLVDLVRELGKFPTIAELKQKAYQDKRFPSRNVFSKFGNMAGIARRLLEYAQETKGLDDIINICEPLCKGILDDNSGLGKMQEVEYSFVYLAKFGRYYKIGRTNYPQRREVEINLQLPEKIKMIHKIKTDDPVGIEAYWHKRFADKHTKGEWFELSADDIKVFRRRRFM